MDRTIVAELLGELVPLTSGAEAEDGTVDGRSPVNPRATTMGLGLCWSILPEDRLNPLPESDQATAYGFAWPDNSLTNRRKHDGRQRGGAHRSGERGAGERPAPLCGDGRKDKSNYPSASGWWWFSSMRCYEPIHTTNNRAN
jgi:hypothetical protein